MIKEQDGHPVFVTTAAEAEAMFSDTMAGKAAELATAGREFFSALAMAFMPPSCRAAVRDALHIENQVQRARNYANAMGSDPNEMERVYRHRLASHAMATARTATDLAEDIREMVQPGAYCVVAYYCHDYCGCCPGRDCPRLFGQGAPCPDGEGVD